MPRSATSPQAQAALAALRERFRASTANTFQAFDRMATQLAVEPDVPDVVESLRRELHRVHGTAGSYGYMEASRLAARLEERAVRWSREPALDREQRGTIIQHFVGALRLAFDADDQGAAEAPARRRVALVGLPAEWVAALRVEGVLHRWAIELLAPADVTAARLRDQAPHVLLTTVALVPRLAGEVGASGVPVVALEERGPRASRTALDDAQRAAVTILDAAVDVATIVELVERLALRSTNAGATILVVDDDPSILAMVRFLLETDGTRVVTLEDPARLHATIAESQPSLLLMDVQMPPHDGIALLRELRSRPEGRELPIVLFSTDVRADVRERAYAAGADEFLLKPLVAGELRARLRSRLERLRLQRLAEGRHPGTGLPLPQRTSRDAASFLERQLAEGRPVSVAVVRPLDADPESDSAAAWLREAQRIASAARGGFAGLHEGIALLLVMPQDAAGLAERLDILAAGCGEARWRAGVVAAEDVAIPELALLQRAAEDACDLAAAVAAASDGAASGAAGRVVRWSREAVDVAPDVIIVEDDVALSDMLAFAMRSAGYSHRAFRSGPEALDGLLRMRTLGRRPLVLLDVDLPGMDGHSLHERLRSERPGSFAVVFVTVHGAEGEQVRALRSGALDWVTKPLSLRVLIAKIPIWLGYAPRGAR